MESRGPGRAIGNPAASGRARCRAQEGATGLAADDDHLTLTSTLSRFAGEGVSRSWARQGEVFGVDLARGGAALGGLHELGAEFGLAGEDEGLEVGERVVEELVLP